MSNGSNWKAIAVAILALAGAVNAAVETYERLKSLFEKPSPAEIQQVDQPPADAVPDEERDGFYIVSGSVTAIVPGTWFSTWENRERSEPSRCATDTGRRGDLPRHHRVRRRIRAGRGMG